MSFTHLEDIHCHSGLSACSADPAMTPQAILSFAEEHDYRMVCLTDHLWDAAIPGSSKWYAPQDIEHVMKSLPLPKGKVPFFFGCETELPMNGVPALARENFDLFDFVVIPPNHIHMKNFVRPPEADTNEKLAKFIEDRLETLLERDIPFRKVGIAHLTGMILGGEKNANVCKYWSEARMLRIFKGYAEAGAGIELNIGAFDEMEESPEIILMPYLAAKEAGCKFYLASDAHERAALESVASRGPAIIERLGLTAQHQYTIPV